MKTYTIPHTDLSVSRLAYGIGMLGVSWRTADLLSKSVAAINTAYENGISFFDTADIYSAGLSETALGMVLKESPGLRNRVVIQSKCGLRLRGGWVPGDPIEMHSIGIDLSRGHIVSATEGSLERLGTDCLDLLLLHAPSALAHPEEIAQAFDDLKRDGKVRHFGVSNFTPSQFALLNRRVDLVTNQIEASPLHIAPFYDGTLDQAQDLGVAPMVWSALAGGRLFTGSDPDSLRVRGVLQRIAGERGISVTTLVYAWLLRHPARLIPLTGSRRLDAMREAVAALDVEIDAQTWYEIWVAGNGAPAP